MPNAGYRPQGPQREIDRITTTDATKTTVQLVPVTDEGAYRLQIEILAERTGGSLGAHGDSACYTRTAFVNNINGQIFVRVITDRTFADPQKAWKVFVEPWGTNVRIAAQGAAGTTIAWTSTSRLFVQL